MIISNELKEKLKKFNINVNKFKSYDDLLIYIDEELLKYMNKDYDLNVKGVILQKIYDEIYNEENKLKD